MKSSLKYIPLLLLFGALFLQLSSLNVEPTLQVFETEEEEDRAKTNEGRDEYFRQMLMDPATGEIPRNIRQLEVAHANQLPTLEDVKFKQAVNYAFTEVGPNDVGGRTRALAVDVTNSNTIIAGGVSGGIWKSTDGGASWTQKTTSSQQPQVTWIAQDPRPGNTSTWYYTTGEFRGNSADAPNGSAFYNGNGIYKSTDNGETWNILPSTNIGNLTTYDSPFDYVSKIVVSPTTGTVFIASNFFGIYRSTDGANFTRVLAETSDHTWFDVAVGTDGKLYATLNDDGGSPTNAPGLYESSNNGTSWTQIGSAPLPAGFDRTFITVDPSDSDNVYVLVEQASNAPSLIYVNAGNTTQNADRTNNIPDYSGDPLLESFAPGDFNLQGGYNMVAAVNPSNANVVYIGATNLYASGNAFASEPTIQQGWIAGYGYQPGEFLYPEHHPDNHVLFFDPANSTRLFSGHDGGVSVTENINARPVVWTSLDNGYNVTQFYTVAIPRIANDDRIVGGTQDNGSPSFRFDTDGTSTFSRDASSGDGSYTYMGQTQAYTSSQNGRVVIYEYLTGADDGEIVTSTGAGFFTRVDPTACVSSSNSQIDERNFIHQYAVDPNNERVMYYPCRDRLYRNTSVFIGVGGFPAFNQSTTTDNWEELQNFDLVNRNVSAISVSDASPSNVLYVAGSASNLSPIIRRLDNAQTGGFPVDVSIPGLVAGTYINDIAVNPLNGSEIIAVISNYNTESLYYSDNAGVTWTAIEGNLASISPNQEGPSARTAEIVEIEGSKRFFVGTSTGLYSTETLNGNSTVWVRESSDAVALNVVSYSDYRSEDNTLAIATHGRGIFIGEPQGSVSNEEVPGTDLPETFTLDQNYPNPFNPSTNIQFALPEASRVNISVFDVNGRRVAQVVGNEQFNGGTHSISFNAAALASGVYIYNLRAVSNTGRVFSQSRTMTLIK